MNFSASMSSLSHSITCRSSMAAGSIGTSSSSRSWVSTKPPGCWRQMARRADQLAGEVQRQAQAPVVEVEVQLVGVLRLRRLPADQPQTCDDSALIRSSGRPSALPTSRSAPLAR